MATTPATAPTAPPSSPPAPTPPATLPAAPSASSSTAATATNKPAKVEETDPVELQVLKSQLPDGNYNLYARVLNIADKGLSKKVVFVCEGTALTVCTDDQGNASCPFNPLTAPADGSKLKVMAHVSGIRDLTLMHVVQRIPMDSVKAAKNNRRAKWFLLVTAALWLICAIVVMPIWGLGKPLISRQEISLLPHLQTTLSRQQVFFNNLPGVRGSDNEIKAPAPIPSTAPTGKWQKPVYLLILLWSGFSVIYAILSMREEVVEAFRHGVDKIIDRHYATASARDPFFQRLLAFSGHLKAIRRPEEMDITPVATGGATTPVLKGGNTFWERVQSSLVSDTLVEIVPEVLKAITAWLKR